MRTSARVPQHLVSRALALEALLRIEQGAYANLVLQELERRLAALPDRDRAFVTELVNGTVRWRILLDHQLSALCSRPLAELDPVALELLRLGAYQLRFMRVPAHAAVDTTVELAKLESHRGVANLVNGVLRRLSREVPPPGEGVLHGVDPVAHLAVANALPAWIVRLWWEERGEAEAEALCQAANRPLPITLRVNLTRTTREALLAAFGEAGVEAAPGILPEGIRLPSGTPLSRLPGFAQGLWYVQGEAAMAAARVLDPRPGETILDVGAAPGGKSTHLAELMGSRGSVIAIDRQERRLALVDDNARRLGLGIVRTVPMDFAEGWNGPPADRILLDAPCSGLGVLARKSDLRHHQAPSEVPKLIAQQAALLDAAVAALAPGGVLLYATCTIHRAENEDQMAPFLARHPEVVPSSLASHLPEIWRGDLAGPEGAWIQLLPDRHGVEGFFLARFRKA